MISEQVFTCRTYSDTGLERIEKWVAENNNRENHDVYMTQPTMPDRNGHRFFHIHWRYSYPISKPSDMDDAVKGYAKALGRARGAIFPIDFGTINA